MREMHIKGKLAAVLLCAALALVALPAAAFAVDGDAEGAGTIAAGTSAALQAQADSAYAFTTQTTSMGVKRAKGVTLANGRYVIASANDAQLVVGVANKNNKGKLQLKAQNGSRAQVWKFTYNWNSKTYIISNVLTGKNLATDGKAVYQDKAVALGSNGFLKQRWLVTSTATGYIITSAYKTDLSLRVAGKKLAVVKLEETDDDDLGQRFWINSTGEWDEDSAVRDGTYTIQAQSDEGQLMEARGGLAKSGQVQQINERTKASLAQMYDIVAVRANLFKIVNVGTGQALTASGGKLVQKPYGYKVDAATQQWKIRVNDDDTVTFVNRDSGKALSFGDVEAEDGTAITLTKLRAQAAQDQKWALSPTTTGLNAIEKRGLEKANGTPTKAHKANMTISIDLTTHYLMLFKRSGANKAWKLSKEWRVSNGANKATLAVVGYKSQFRQNNKWEHGYMAYYWSRMGARQYMHSYVDYGSWVDRRLGMSISNGCVRMSTENAKYVYYGVQSQSRVQRYY